MRRIHTGAGRLGLALILAALALPASAGAASIGVTITADTVANEGQCSLREAVTAANENAANPTDCPDGDSGLDTIQLGAGTYVIGGAAGDDANASGDLDLDSAGGDVTIDGAGAAATIIDANDSDRVIHGVGAGPDDLTVSDVTITDGSAAATFGGGIRSADGGTLTVTNSTVSNNVVTGPVGGSGGGIYVSPLATALNVDGSAITGNTISMTADAAGNLISGGGIQAPPEVTITDSEIIGNSITTAEPADTPQGGGVSTHTSPTGVTITGTTIANNTLTGGIQHLGGGLALTDAVAADSPLLVTNSTFSGNSATGAATARGGGIYVRGGLVSIAQVTLAGNSAVQGRAVYREVDASSTFTIRGSILSEDGANECVGAAAIGSGGHNIDRGTSCAFAGTGDQSSTDPGLLPLADNGGPTETRAIPDGSAAENVVPAADCDDASGSPLLADQRGFPRPFPAGGSCDGGAYELNRTCLGRGVTTLAGSSSADSILGTSGDDVLAAGAGNDTIAPGAGNDRVCGEAGTDTASFAGGAKVTVNLATGTASGQGTDLLSTIENLTGSSLADTLLGNSLANLIRAGKGADTARGGGGNDTLLGEAGNDRLFGQAGRDHLTGGKGRRDRCNGGGGRDRRRAKGCEVRRRIP